MKLWEKAALVAYFKGYRVTDDGQLLSPKNEALVLKAKASDRGYPRFGVWLDDEKRAVRITAHQFAALCFFGLKAFTSQCIRHKNDVRTDFSRGNLMLGTQVQNERDKCPNARKRVASLAGSSTQAARAYQELQADAPEGCKVCSGCRDPKEATTEYFHKSAKAKDGLAHLCKECRSKRRKGEKSSGEQNQVDTTHIQPVAGLQAS